MEGAISMAAALLVSVLLARVLRPAGFGLYALVMSIVSFTYLLARAGIPGTVRRYAAEFDGRGDRGLIGTVAGRGLRSAIIAAVVSAFLLALAAAPLSAFFRGTELSLYLLIGAGLLIPMVPLSVLRALLGGLQEYRFLLHVSLWTSPAWVVLCGLALFAHEGIAGVLVATLVIELVNIGALSRKVIQSVPIRVQGALPDEIRVRLRSYNLALAALILLDIIVWQRSELLFLGRLSTANQLSFYAVPFALTERVADLIPGAVLGVLLPSLAYARASADPTRFSALLREALRDLGFLTVPIVASGILLAPLLIGLLYGPGFAPATPVLQILLVAILFSVLGQACRSTLLSLESPGLLVKSGVAAALLSVALDLLLIPRWNAVGAAIANTAVQAIWALTMVALLRRRMGHRHVSIVQEVATSS